MAVSDDSYPGRILLGHITGISGLRGWVKVHSDTEPRENIFAYKSWWINQAGKWSEVNVTNGRPQGKTIVVHVKGVDSPEAAADLIGAKIAVDRQALPEPAVGEYYWTDLVGMQVFTIDGVEIGPIDRLFETGANDVAVVSDLRERPTDESETGKPAKNMSREVLVPWLVPDVVTDVDLQDRRITVDWDPDF